MRADSCALRHDGPIAVVDEGNGIRGRGKFSSNSYCNNLHTV